MSRFYNNCVDEASLTTLCPICLDSFQGAKGDVYKRQDCDLTSDKLAESIQTNPAYVRQLMSALRKGGLLVSVKGHPRPALAREPEKITLLDAYRAEIGRAHV